MSADKPTNTGGERKAETRSDELAAAHAYLDTLQVLGRDAGKDRGLPLEERLRSLFGDRPGAAGPATGGSLEERAAIAEARLIVLERQMEVMRSYIGYSSYEGRQVLQYLGERLEAIERRTELPPFVRSTASLPAFLGIGRGW